MENRGLNGWFEVFKVGEFTDSAGAKHKFSYSDLDDIAQSYNPSEHEAPIVIGHPKTDSPAWGWVESLKSRGGSLFVKAKQVVPEFEDMVKNGLFKKRSIALYPGNKLKHIGFLGAMPPAVKGLGDIKFGDLLNSPAYEFSEESLFDPGERLNILINEELKKPDHIDQYNRRITRSLSFSEAMGIVTAQNPELTRAYQINMSGR